MTFACRGAPLPTPLCLDIAHMRPHRIAFSRSMTPLCVNGSLYKCCLPSSHSPRRVT